MKIIQSSEFHQGCQNLINYSQAHQKGETLLFDEKLGVHKKFSLWNFITRILGGSNLVKVGQAVNTFVEKNEKQLQGLDKDKLEKIKDSVSLLWIKAGDSKDIKLQKGACPLLLSALSKIDEIMKKK